MFSARETRVTGLVLIASLAARVSANPILLSSAHARQSEAQLPARTRQPPRCRAWQHAVDDTRTRPDNRVPGSLGRAPPAPQCALDHLALPELDPDDPPITQARALTRVEPGHLIPSLERLDDLLDET